MHHRAVALAAADDLVVAVLLGKDRRTRVDVVGKHPDHLVGTCGDVDRLTGGNLTHDGHSFMADWRAC
ncbi:Uncharacterised protein [Mycobacteroides abscessus subsp. abscessus]|nr:Uncharacterised protein [Mycobacteroides abscessus subsp. abscessus]